MKSQKTKYNSKWVTQNKIVLTCFALSIMVLPATFKLIPLMSGARENRPLVSRYSAASRPASVSSITEKQTLRVMTLNLAHGRRDGFNQALQKNKTIKTNLNDISGVLKRENPDLVALQEADGPSFWSGMLNHVDYLAEKVGFSYSIYGEHVKAIKISYGTALLSMLPIRDPVSITFKPSPPTLPKGFVIATITWPGDPNMEIDIISLHLDFFRESIRKKQIEEMIDILSSRNKPMIVMGDFNSEWTTDESILRTFAEKFALKGYKPWSPNMSTFPLLNKRLDWILISSDLEFITYGVLSDNISDHRGVICEIKKTVIRNI